jgi:membrane protein EpsK
MSRSRQIAINAVSQSGVTILSAALGMVLVPFLIAKLGKGGYGLIAVTIAVSGACALAELGISGALGRQLAEALAKKDDAKYRELLSTALGLNLLMGLLCASAVFLLARPLARSFTLNGSLFDTGVFLLKTYGAAHVLFTFLMPAPKAVLASHNRFDTSSQIEAVRRLCETAGLFLVLAGTGAGIAGWAAVCVTTDAVCTVLLWRAAARTHTRLGVGVSAMRLSSVKELFSLGSQFTLLQLSGQLSVNADPFILTACLGPASVSLYRPPAQVFNAVSPVVFTLANQLHPMATKAHVEGDRKDLAAILFRGTKYTMLMGTVFCAIVITLAYPLCKVWLGKVLGEEYRICAAVLTVQAVTQLAAFAAGTQWPVLLGMRRTAFAAYGRLAFAILNILCSWLLVRYTSLGVLGVVLPTMVIELIWRPMLVHHVCRTLDVSIWDYVKQAYLSPLLIGAAVAGTGFAAWRLVPPSHLWGLVATGCALGIFGAALVWLVGFNPTDRAAMVRVVQFCRVDAPLNLGTSS